MNRLFSTAGIIILIFLSSQNILSNAVSNAAALALAVLSAALMCVSVILKDKKANRS